MAASVIAAASAGPGTRFTLDRRHFGVVHTRLRALTELPT